MKDTLNRAQNSKQSSHTQAVEKNACESWQTGQAQLWKFTLMYTSPFLWLCMCYPPHHTQHFIKLSWFGCACRVWKGMNILKVIHSGCAPVAVKGADGGMPRLRCLGHIGWLEKVFQQRFLYAAFIFQDVSVSVNKHFERIMFTPRWRKKSTLLFVFFVTLLKGKGWGRSLCWDFKPSFPELSDPSKALWARHFVFWKLCAIKISSINDVRNSGTCFDIGK